MVGGGGCVYVCVCWFATSLCASILALPSALQQEAYFPDEEDQEQMARDREEDARTEQEVVREAPLEVPDYSHLMDTIARFAPHPYHLRSLHRGGVGQQHQGVGQQQQGAGQQKEEIEEQGMLISCRNVSPCTDNCFLLIMTYSILIASCSLLQGQGPLPAVGPPAVLPAPPRPPPGANSQGPVRCSGGARPADETGSGQGEGWYLGGRVCRHVP